MRRRGTAASTSFELRLDDQLLVTLEGCIPSSEPNWQTCQFKPTPAFAKYRPLFDAVSKAGDQESLTRAIDALEELNIVLVDVTTGYATPEFMMHIEGNTAELRYA